MDIETETTRYLLPVMAPVLSSIFAMLQNKGTSSRRVEELSFALPFFFSLLICITASWWFWEENPNLLLLTICYMGVSVLIGFLGHLVHEWWESSYGKGLRASDLGLENCSPGQLKAAQQVKLETE